MQFDWDTIYTYEHKSYIISETLTDSILCRISWPFISKDLNLIFQNKAIGTVYPRYIEVKGMVKTKFKITSFGDYKLKPKYKKNHGKIL